MDVPLPLGARCRPDQLCGASRECAGRRPASRSMRLSPGKIEAGFLEMLGLLDNHLASRPYLFGGRPAFGDFGLWGQIYQMWKDPTAGALIEGGAPRVLDWVHRMLWPKAEGAFEGWSTLEPTLMPILSNQIGPRFMLWTSAN